MSRSATTTFRVRYGETDKMGVVYHPNYLVWCEIGRTELIRELGVSYADMERDGIYLAVAEASVRYGAAAHYDDRIAVESRVEQARSRSITFGYEIRRLDPSPARLATASTTLVSIDAAGRTRQLPGSILDLFRA